MLGASTGEAREYTLPNGKTQKVVIIEAHPFSG
nr:hypothetical protein [Nakamurella antarctica]